MKKFLIVMGVIFGILSFIFYFTSIKELDSSSASVLGTSSVVNIQGTVFCAACAVLCAVNIVGSIILGSHEKLEEMITNLREIVTAKDTMPSETKSKTVPQVPQSEEKPTERVRTVQKNENPDWIDDGDNFVRCPQCNSRMSIDFIKARRKCPDCGTVYLKEHLIEKPQPEKNF